MADNEKYKVGFLSGNERRKKGLYLAAALLGLLIIVVVIVVVVISVTDSKKASPVGKAVDSGKSEGLRRTTNCGSISGIKEAASDGTPIYSFKGIPYAYPPVGNLRWKPPMPLSGNGSCWKGDRSATKFASICAQISTEGKILGTEDCLYLNVWTPAFDRSKNLPVVVYIHGGALARGNGDIPPIRELGRFGIVAVSMNYRLNAFGFLTLDVLSEASSSNITSNYAFVDQTEAFKWVKANIREFGGNPNRVTILGFSAGAKSVLGLLASPLTNGLFHAAIAMSPSPLYYVSQAKASKDNAVFIQRARCNKATKNETVSCLYGLSTVAVLLAIPWNVYPSWSYASYYRLPVKGVFSGAISVIDDVVVPTVPSQLANVKFTINGRIPVMVGSTGQEMETRILTIDNITHSKFVNFVNKSLNTFGSNLTNEILSAYGVGSQNLSYDLTLYTMATDVRSGCQTDIMMRNASRSQKHVLYRYMTTNVPSKPVLRDGRCCIKYAYHGWDFNALLDFPFQSPNPISSTDRAFANSLQADFISFMKTGKPARADWVPFTDREYMEYGTGYARVNRNNSYQEKQCNVWIDNGLHDYGWML